MLSPAFAPTTPCGMRSATDRLHAAPRTRLLCLEGARLRRPPDSDRRYVLRLEGARFRPPGSRFRLASARFQPPWPVCGSERETG
jgi:hypothetical protein